jgi:hypothetical protein
MLEVERIELSSLWTLNKSYFYMHSAPKNFKEEVFNAGHARQDPFHIRYILLLSYLACSIRKEIPSV